MCQPGRPVLARQPKSIARSEQTIPPALQHLSTCSHACGAGPRLPYREAYLAPGCLNHWRHVNLDFSVAAM